MVTFPGRPTTSRGDVETTVKLEGVWVTAGATKARARMIELCIGFMLSSACRTTNLVVVGVMLTVNSHLMYTDGDVAVSCCLELPVPDFYISVPAQLNQSIDVIRITFCELIQQG